MCSGRTGEDPSGIGGRTGSPPPQELRYNDGTMIEGENIGGLSGATAEEVEEARQVEIRAKQET